MSLKTLGLRDLIILFALILSTFFLNGCSGCTYFFLKIESLDKSNQDLGSTQGGQNPGSSDVNSPTSFQIIITNGTVLRGANDTTYTDFITLKFDTTITEELSIQLDSSLSEATVSDFELPITTISFAKGEQEKKISLIVKGNPGSGLYDKQIVIKANVQNHTEFQEQQSNIVIHDTQPLILNVNPLAPLNGSLWTSFVRSSVILNWITPLIKIDFSTTIVDDNLCQLTICTNHGGELKKVVISNEKSCVNLELIDNIDAFEWRCNDSSPPVYFYSVGFKENKGLSNLIVSSGSAWKDMQVQLFKNSNLVQSSSFTKWWANTVSPLNLTTINDGGVDPRLDLNTPYTVYAVTENVSTRGITINAPNISLVTLTGATLSSTATLENSDCDTYSGGTQNCMILNTGSNYFWLEGNYKGKNNSYFYYSQNSSRNQRIHLANVDLNGGDGFYFDSLYSFVDHLNILNGKNGIIGWLNLSGLFTIKLDKMVAVGTAINLNGTLLQLNDIVVRGQKGTSDGILLAGNKVNLTNFKIIETGTALNTSGAEKNIINGLIANNSSYGGQIWSHYTNLSNLTVVNNDVGLRQVQYSQTLDSILMVNNNSALSVNSSLNPTNYSYSNIAVIDSQTSNINIGNNVTDLVWTGDLFLGDDASPCTYGTGISNVGLVNSTCDAAGSSSFTKTVGLDGESAFIGWSNDSLNLQGSSGLLGLAFASITDWFNFESLMRAWIPFNTTTPWPLSNIRGPCTSGNCGIFDYTIANSTVFKNYYAVFMEGQSCPVKTKGSNALEYKSAGGNSFRLQGALEYIFDGRGNDNGFCEANENCYFVSDFGANLKDPNSYTKQCIYDPDGSSLTNINIYGE